MNLFLNQVVIARSLLDQTHGGLNISSTYTREACPFGIYLTHLLLVVGDVLYSVLAFLRKLLDVSLAHVPFGPE